MEEILNNGLTWTTLMEIRELMLWVIALEMLGWVFVTWLFAALYRCCKRPVTADVHIGQMTEQTTGQWSHGLCDCLSDCEVCCCAWFCPGIRWSETMSYVPALSVCCASGFWTWL